MVEGFALAVWVADEVFCGFGQIEHGFEIDDLVAGLGDVGVALCEQLEVSEVFFYFFFGQVVFCIDVHGWFVDVLFGIC